MSNPQSVQLSADGKKTKQLTKLQKRVLAVLLENPKASKYAWMNAVWPPGHFPKMYLYSANGGPYVAIMHLRRAINVLEKAGIFRTGLGGQASFNKKVLDQYAEVFT